MAIDVPVAKRYVELAAWAAEQPLALEEEDAYIRAYRHHPANSKVRRFFRKGYTVIFNYGVLTLAAKEAAEEQLDRLGGRFLTARDRGFAQQRRSWPDAWGFETEHFLILSNADHALVLRFGQECENLYKGLPVFLGKSVPLRASRKKEKLVVWLFRDRASYGAVLQNLGLYQGQDPGSAGFFGGYKRAYYYWSGGGYPRNPLPAFRALTESLYHEGTHHLLAMQLGAVDKGSAAELKSWWIGEATASYLETMEVTTDADGQRSFAFGFADPDGGYRAKNGHLRAVRDEAKKNELMRLLQFTTCTWEVWQARGMRNYNQALGLAHYLCHAEGGKHRPVFLECVRQYHTVGGAQQYVWKLCGVKEAEFSRAFAEWCRQLK
jgi:hypothetical protein